MAIVTGPLFSQEARGQFAKTVVFRRRKGQNVAASYVIPANPNTASQQTNRDYIAIVGIIISRLNRSGAALMGEAQSIQDWATELAVGTFTWANYIASRMLGANNSLIAANVVAYNALTAQQQGVWDAEAEEAPFSAVEVVRGSGTTFSTGAQLYILQRTIRQLGYGPAFDAANPVPSDVIEV